MARMATQTRVTEAMSAVPNDTRVRYAAAARAFCKAGSSRSFKERFRSRALKSGGSTYRMSPSSETCGSSGGMLDA